jgi:hypothetical protein
MTLSLIDRVKIEERSIAWCADIVAILVVCCAGATPATFARHVGE